MKAYEQIHSKECSSNDLFDWGKSFTTDKSHQNPYVALQDQDDAKSSASPSVFRARRHLDRKIHPFFVGNEQPSLGFWVTNDRGLQNPYAKNQRLADEVSEQVIPPQQNEIHSLSKQDFKRRSAFILRQYMPAKSRGLTPEFKKFIDGGLCKDGHCRAQIISELEKYCVASEGLDKAFLNRDKDTDFLTKLNGLLEP